MSDIVIGLVIVVALAAVVYAVVSLLRGGKDDVSKRLDRYVEGVPLEEGDRRKGGKDDRSSFLGKRLDEALTKRGFAENLRTQLARANLKLTAGEFLAATVICVILLAGAAFILRGSAIFALGAGVVGFFAPRWYLGYLQRKRLKTFNDQLGDTISLLVNSIRSGYSVMQAMEAVAREMGPPVSEEFDRVVKEVQLGLGMEQALDNMLRRVSSDDLDLLITAINVQREVGGNLAEVLDSISFTIRERVRILGEIRALTAQARGSGYMISLMPIGLTIFIYLVNPSFIMALTEDPCGWIMIGFAVTGLILGFIIIQKLVDIKV